MSHKVKNQIVELQKGTLKFRYEEPSNWVRLTLLDENGKEREEIPIQLSFLELFYETMRALEHNVK